ncbi:acetoacetate-CoA ligase [Rhizodiscina lignyota]|uniref:Acetoacetate-CoA ligase n=1 Tax=Rhizodiscina lignyota TaxID=1504668 RepID=A0A9P4I6K0_9PEZI|nr:acetoacetate-CoA ligase [Rhizodiscina lignyota]
MPRKLWEHPHPQTTRLWRFMEKVNKKRGLSLKGYHDLHKWSVGENRIEFWNDLWQEIALIHEGDYARPVDPTLRMDSIPHWYQGTRMNWAENVLFTANPRNTSVRSTAIKHDYKIACTEVREGVTSVVNLTWGDLRRRVGLLANAMRARGLKKGDRVAVVASNSIDTLTVFLATTSIGGLFSSSSTDMGTKGVLDRLLQVKPRWVFVDDFAVYNGKTIDLRSKMKEIVAGVNEMREFDGLVSQPRFDDAADVSGVPRATTMAEFMGAANGDSTLTFECVEFRDPFLIVYSSGTTGMPKCIVHSVGGVLMNAMKEGYLQRGMGAETVGMQYTTTGWIMYLSSLMYLLYGGRAILYDGSPFMPDLKAFVKLAGDQKVTNWGISPRYLQELQKNKIHPRDVTDLSNLQTVTSTGMVFPDALFEWVYDVGFPPHVQLANVSGGTDLAGCLGTDNLITPVYVGGCQGASLGIDVQVYDQQMEGGKGVKGRQVEDGVPGEIVVTKSFPNQPVYFYGDPTGDKYFNAYYARFDDVWAHGDFVMIHPVTRQVIFLGRADGVLNPSGVRFGSAEIYNVIDEFFSTDIQDSICVGQRRPQDNDESVMLFLLMKPGKKFTQQLASAVKDRIGKELSKRHIPKYVFETPEIPTTINLKKVELPVKQIVSGRNIKPSDTLANKHCLEYYKQFAKVEELVERRSKL